MRRRTVLSTLALAVLPVAGCTAPGEPTTDETVIPTSSETATSTETPSADVTPDPDDPMLFVLSNGTERELTLTLRLTRADQTFIDETVMLAADGSREYDSGVRSPGEYELVASVDGGPERTMTLDIEAFDIESGANHYVQVTADDITVYWEE
jgi:hypothetical protein